MFGKDKERGFTRMKGGGKRRFNDSFICLWIVLRFAVLRGQNCCNWSWGVGTGSRYLSFVYGLACALQFCVGKTAIIWREVFRAGSKCLSFVYGLSCALQFCGGKTADGLFVADKFNFSDFFTETELYKQKRTRSFCLLGRRSASFLCLNEFFRESVIPN